MRSCIGSSNDRNPERAFELVVAGASWGGLLAIQTVLTTLGSEFPLPLALVLHRDKAGDDTLVRALQEHTALLVREPEDKELIDPGHVYLAPADYHLLVDEDHFALSIDAPVWFARPSIDVLFESAAEALGQCVIGVLMTGNNQDGVAGLASIRRMGGLTMAQDPATAEAPVMPAAAVDAGVVQHVLTLEEIGRYLIEAATGRLRRTAPRKSTRLHGGG